MVLARRWWPVPALVAVAVVVQNVVLSRYDVSGHAAEHLSSAGTPFLAVVLVAILLWVTPGARRQPAVLASAAAWLVSTVFVAVGNIRVVDTLIRVGDRRTPTDRLADTPAISSAHDLANSAPWWGVAAALALTAAFWGHRHVSGRVGIGAAVLNVVFPPWIIPGAGVLVLTVGRCLARNRALGAVPAPRAG